MLHGILLMTTGFRSVLGKLIIASAWLCASLLANTALADDVKAEVARNPVPASDSSLAQGKKQFESLCSGCHGVHGVPAPTPVQQVKPPANISDDKWEHGGSDTEIFHTIKNGIAPDFAMVPWAGAISDEDIWNIVNYIRTLSPKKAG